MCFIIITMIMYRFFPMEVLPTPYIDVEERAFKG